MTRRKYICRKCGCKFEKNVIEAEEAREKRLTGPPVTCPDCGSADVERR